MPRIPETLRLKGRLTTGEVWANGKPLSPERSLEVCNHSPTGFSWGYGGSGPAQLALAILLKYLSKEKAVALYQDFKREVIARLPEEDFEKEVDIRQWIAGTRDQMSDDDLRCPHCGRVLDEVDDILQYIDPEDWEIVRPFNHEEDSSCDKGCTKLSKAVLRVECPACEKPYAATVLQEESCRTGSIQPVISLT